MGGNIVTEFFKHVRMTKTRLEAFSDGVFAIVITLLVLDIHLPDTEIGTDAELRALLFHTLPNILTYIFSFLVVGVFWLAHHRIFGLIKAVNHYLMWSNIFYLLTIALIPFPAAVLARHPMYTTSVLFYTGVLFICGVQHFVLIRFVYRHKHFQEAAISPATYYNALKIAAVGPVCYLLASVFSFVHPAISFCFIIAALCFYIFFAQHFLSKQIEVNPADVKKDSSNNPAKPLAAKTKGQAVHHPGKQN